MGLGSHEKKIEAMQPLTSDFHILASIKCPVKHQPVDHWDQDFAWRVQMGLGLHEKKMEAVRPLTSDFHKLASIQGPIKHQPVDQDCAWRVQMGLGFHENKPKMAYSRDALIRD